MVPSGGKSDRINKSPQEGFRTFIIVEIVYSLTIAKECYLTLW